MGTAASGLEGIIAGALQGPLHGGANQDVIRTGQVQLVRMSRHMEETVKEVKGLIPTLDFYSALTYDSLGIPIGER